MQVPAMAGSSGALELVSHDSARFTSDVGTFLKKILRVTARLSQRLYGFMHHCASRNLTSPMGKA